MHKKKRSHSNSGISEGGGESLEEEETQMKTPIGRATEVEGNDDRRAERSTETVGKEGLVVEDGICVMLGKGDKYQIYVCNDRVAVVEGKQHTNRNG
jgi:hypothetical protein